MGAVWMLARHELRGRWRSTIALAVLVGLVGAVVLASVAGARRTLSSLDRFEDSSRASDVEINAGGVSAEKLREFRATDGVAAVGVLRQLTLYSESIGFLPIAGPVDGGFGNLVDRARLVHGRRASTADELTIGERLADRLDVGVGDHLRFQSFSPEQVAETTTDSSTDPRGPEFDFEIVGIVRRPLDLGARGDRGGVIVPTRAFVNATADTVGSFSGMVLRVRTVRGEADVVPVLAAAARIFGDSPQFEAQGLSIEGQGVRSAIDVATVALWVLAAVSALAGVAAIGLTLARHLARSADGAHTLRALGVQQRQRWAATTLPVVPIAIGGAAMAVVGATFLSALFPIGVARQAEPDPGVHIDALVTGLGFLAVVVVVVVVGGLAAFVAGARAAPARARPSIPSQAAAAMGLPPSMATGIGFALERGRVQGGVPVRSAVAGATLGVVGVVAALTLAMNLDRVATVPRLFGWTWDVAVVGADTGEECGDAGGVARQEGVGDVALLCYGDVVVSGHPLTGWAFRAVEGTIGPEIVAGHAPRGRREVALGAASLEATGREIGERVTVRVPLGNGRSREESYEVVGQVVVPALDDAQPLADSALFTPAGLDEGGGIDDDYLLVRLNAPLSGALAAHLRELGDGFAPMGPIVPGEIERLRQIDFLPVLLAVFVALVALTAVGYALAVAVRRRRRDLAVLKTLGFVRRQVRATVAWQATTVGVIGLVVGGVLGVVIGRFVWHAVADDLGVSPTASTPLVIVLSARARLDPRRQPPCRAARARSAARTRPAIVLRSE